MLALQSFALPQLRCCIAPSVLGSAERLREQAQAAPLTRFQTEWPSLIMDRFKYTFIQVYENTFILFSEWSLLVNRQRGEAKIADHKTLDARKDQNVFNSVSQSARPFFKPPSAKRVFEAHHSCQLLA